MEHERVSIYVNGPVGKNESEISSHQSKVAASAWKSNGTNTYIDICLFLYRSKREVICKKVLQNPRIILNVLIGEQLEFRLDFSTFSLSCTTMMSLSLIKRYRHFWWLLHSIATAGCFQIQRRFRKKFLYCFSFAKINAQLNKHLPPNKHYHDRLISCKKIYRKYML